MALRWPRSDALTAGVGRLMGGLPGLAPTFLVVALLACVLVPLPTVLVDLLLSLSLAGAVLLLVASIAVRQSTELLNFPSLLLLVTLYRLALNISTTRLILSQGDAGEVIDAFASFVIRGDLIVGGVMFVIITIIQYVVIAKGAERVAEVAARFALDGLPGHQAAIDADLRAGVLSASEASARRAQLAERSSFYGAMDGAVRFVKGDAVAGLAIIVVNLLGGLAIGMTKFGYGWQQSLEHFGRLTIGDGLLAQIPALLVSLAAGVLVSRVDRRQGAGSAVGWLRPAMLVVPATFLTVLGLVPSMPSLAFLVTAVGLVTAALVLAARDAFADGLRPSTAMDEGIIVRAATRDVEHEAELERALVEVRLRCSGALGLEVPSVRLECRPEQPPGRVEIFASERLWRRHEGLTDADAMVLATFRAIMEHAPTLVDLQRLDHDLERLRATHPLLVKRALDVVSLEELLGIVRSFVAERIPLPPLRVLLTPIVECRRLHDAPDREQFPEIIRQELAPHWVPGLVDGLYRVGEPTWLRLTPDAEEIVMDATLLTQGGVMLQLSRAQRQRWVEHIKAATEGDGPIVLIATPDARRRVAALVATAVPFIPVLSTAELDVAHTISGTDPSSRWLDLPDGD